MTPQERDLKLQRLFTWSENPAEEADTLRDEILKLSDTGKKCRM